MYSIKYIKGSKICFKRINFSLFLGYNKYLNILREFNKTINSILVWINPVVKSLVIGVKKTITHQDVEKKQDALQSTGKLFKEK